MAVEMLSILIKHSNIEPLRVFDTQLVISQLADDTTLFLRNIEQIPQAIQTINFFTKASGLQLNLTKCVLMPIHNCQSVEECGIPVRTSVKYLGVHVTKDSKLSETLNIWKKVEECKHRLDRWSSRDLSIFGRTFITKMESLSRCIYPAYSLCIPKKAIRAINSLNFDYIWKRRTHYLKKTSLVQKYENGGLQAIDFDCLNGTLKIKWLKSFLSNTDSLWHCIPRNVFKDIAHLKFVLCCDFTVQKLPIKLSAFHSQVLFYWQMLFKHNFSPHDTPLWNCRFIQFRHKSLYVQEWQEKGIWSILHLLDDSGHFLSFQTLQNKYNLNCDLKKYQTVLKALPQAFVALAKTSRPLPQTAPRLPTLLVDGKNFIHKTLSNRLIRSLLTAHLHPPQIQRNQIIYKINTYSFQKLCRLYLKEPVCPKMKEIHFKSLKGIYPSSDLLHKRFKLELTRCVFCDEAFESTDHLFFSCVYSNTFWSDITDWLESKIQNITNFTEKDVLCGLENKNRNNELILNFIIITGKFFIHKSKWLKVRPTFIGFKNYLQQYCLSIKQVKSKAAVAINQMNLFSE